jgi:hypothetical protein
MPRSKFPRKPEKTFRLPKATSVAACATPEYRDVSAGTGSPCPLIKPVMAIRNTLGEEASPIPDPDEALPIYIDESSPIEVVTKIEVVPVTPEVGRVVPIRPSSSPPKVPIPKSKVFPPSGLAAVPEESTHMFPPQHGLIPYWGVPMYPPMMMCPATHMYGQAVPSPNNPHATVIHISGQITPGTGAIILVPSGLPVNESAPHSECPSTVSGETGPIVCLIERNVFKQWFDGTAPSELREFPRVKKYKGAETFMHWLQGKKRLFWDSKLIVLIRMAEVKNLIAELGKHFPESAIAPRVAKRVFAFEHLYMPDSPSTPLHPTDPILRDINISRCLDEACRAALAETHQTVA